MKKLLLTAAAACAIAAPAMAEEVAGWSLSGNIALTSDYVFRGFTQNGGNPAFQGGFDASYGAFYVGTWGSSVNFASAGTELDLYAGYKPTFGKLSTDLGVVGYFYPGAKDKAAELDYAEIYAKASYPVIEPWTIGAQAFYSPEFTGETGDAWYLEANTAYTITPALSASGAFGWQTVDKLDFEPSTAAQDDDYLTWNVGATYTVAGFGLDVRYSDTNIKSVDSDQIADERVAVTLKRAL